MLHGNYYELRVGDSEAYLDPNWAQVHDALQRLDGSNLNMLALTRIGVGALVVGGGNDGRYIVIYNPESVGSPSLTLTNENQVCGEVEIVAQTPDMYPARYCVGKSQVIKVFDHFFAHGKLPGDVAWEPD